MGLTSAVAANAARPLALGTHDPGDLPPAIPFEPGVLAVDASPPRITFPGVDWTTIGTLAPSVNDHLDDQTPLGRFARAVRPICVGALLAIPTLGPATVGVVALFDAARAMAMVAASTAFLRGIPTEIVLLIGALATGYGVARTIEKTKGDEE